MNFLLKNLNWILSKPFSSSFFLKNKQLLKETNSNHPDYNNLTEASSEMDSVAEKINDVKKRIDIVEKYIDGKGGSNVM